MPDPFCSRREFLKTLAAGAVAASLAGCEFKDQHFSSRRNPPLPPNVVIILTDDLGYADVGTFGAKDFNTPNLDRMAADGVRFTSFYVGAAKCTPSRAALMTGCYPQRVGMPGVLEAHKPIGLNPDETTIAELVKTRGYATAMFGKWHLGDNPAFLPPNQGFDEFFGLPYSQDIAPWSWYKDYPPLPLLEGTRVVATNPDISQLTTWYTDRAVNFIDRNKDRPFLLYVAHNMPHVPLAVSDKFKGKSKRGLYGDVVEEIDWSVGRILNAIKQDGIDDRTLVIFTSDNGPWLVYGDHAGSAKPLREGKGTTFDGGHRTPCIMRFPGKIPAGSVCPEVVTIMDIFPTIAGLSGAKLPAGRIIDGRNIWPLMSGRPGAKSPHEAYYYYNMWTLEAVRSGKWKLHIPHKYYTVATAGKDGKPGKYASMDMDLSLFDLEKDPGEMNDVAYENGEVCARLLKLVKKMQEDLGDFNRGIPGKNRRPPGRVEGWDTEYPPKK